MKHPPPTQYQSGRHFIGPLPGQSDLIGAIEAICAQKAINSATFTVTGAVSSSTIGVFDPVQGVHVTHLEKEATELLSCRGTFSAMGGKPRVTATVILASQQGQLTGGHLFSDTIIHDAEIDLQELIDIR